MENLAHSASFHSSEKTAPSNSGIKHLAMRPAVALTRGSLQRHPSDFKSSEDPPCANQQQSSWTIIAQKLAAVRDLDHANYTVWHTKILLTFPHGALTA
jgi:hypothetical protein